MASVAFPKRQRRMAVRTTMKLESQLPGVRDLQCPFLTKHIKVEQANTQCYWKTNLERIMVKKAPKPGRRTRRWPAMGPRVRCLRSATTTGVKKQFAMWAGLQDADATANDVKRRMTMTNPEKLHEPFVGDT